MEAQLNAVREVRTDLTAEAVFRCLGPSPAAAREGLRDEVALALRDAARLSRPRAALRTHRIVKAQRGRVAFEDGTVLAGKMLPHLFEGAGGGLFVLATAGPGIERRVRELFAAGDEVEAFVLDAAGSAMVLEAFAKTVGQAAADLSSAGFGTGPCLMPGSDYWALDGQRDVFRALPASEIGVRLLDSMLMEPQKSQTAVIPFGEQLRIQGDPGVSLC